MKTMTTMELRLISAIVLVGTLALSCNGQYVRCGGKLTAKQGVIQSPNFPGPFMTPVFCEWVIQAPPKLKIVLYLTQYYLKGFFHVYEFDHYTNKDEYIGERKLATVNCEDEVWSIVAHKPFMVLRFAVQEMGNIHLRVLDHLIDVYGFNITYELVNKHEIDSKWTCSAFDCSYLGNCRASSDFSQYKCHCFPGFFGEACQYGPHCNPMINKNMCQNNGSCRYLYGDYVNICQCIPGYYGSMCEQRLDGLHPSDCAVLDCEQTCITNVRKTLCGCHNGFRLGSDNRSCIHIDRHKYSVRFVLTNNTLSISLTEKQTLQNKIIQGFEQRGAFSVENITISKAGQEEEIQFYSNSFEKQIVDNVLHDVLNSLPAIQIKKESVTFTSMPELYLLSTTMRVDSGTGLAALEHKSMTLSCVARGPPNITFKWFKDGFLLDLNLFQRRARETLIPAVRDNMLTSVLTFDRVSSLDRGTFTCEASDGERAENKSLAVNVITVPLVDLYPLSVSVVEGESMSIICMSPDDTNKNFTYIWRTSEGMQIQPGRSDQIVEDLFPTGTRLYIPRVKTSQNFSCTVENKAGEFTLTSYVFMQKANAVNMSCGKSYHKQVLWKKTAGNHFDKERCPSETGGYATRHCVCSGEVCSWAEPNFARCQSVYLVYEVYDKLEMLRLGYQQTTIKYVYDRLCEFIVKNNVNLYSGDVELAVSILHELLRHLEQFPQLADKDDKISVSSLIEVMDLMVSATNQSTWEEKLDMNVSLYFLRICRIISRSISNVLVMDLSKEITSSTLDVKVHTIKIEERNMTGVNEESPVVTYTRELSVISFTHRAIQLMLSAKEVDSSIENKRSISNVYSVFPTQWNSNDIQDSLAYIPIHHTQMTEPSKDTHTICVSWSFDERFSQYGRWTTNDCKLVSTNKDSSVCKCSLSGHFMVAVTPLSSLDITDQQLTIPSFTVESHLGLPIIIACGINIVLLGVTMLIYAVKRRLLIGDEYTIHFSFMLSVLLKCVTFLVCLRNQYSTIMCSVGRIVIYFFFIVAHSLIFVESMHIFLTVGQKGDRKRHWHKYMLIGWGIPTALTIFFGIASQIFDESTNCWLICWIEQTRWHFYGFIIPIIALDIAVFLMLILALRSCLSNTDETRYTSKKTFLLTCLKPISIIIFLNVYSYLSTSLSTNLNQGKVIAFSTFMVIMVVIVFLVRVVFDKKLKHVFFKQKPPPTDSAPLKSMKRNSSSSFKAYMKPDLVQQSVPKREGVNKHYDLVNRTKFTDERKRQLSFLLGSSHPDGHSSAQCQDRRSDRSISFCLPSDNGAADSGIFGSENENDRFLVGSDSTNHISSLQQTISVEVHSPSVQNGFIINDNFEPFPELVQRNSCKNIILHTTKSNGIVRPKQKYYIDPKSNQEISESGESTTMLLPNTQTEDLSDEQESDDI